MTFAQPDMNSKGIRLALLGLGLLLVGLFAPAKCHIQRDDRFRSLDETQCDSMFTLGRFEDESIVSSGELSWYMVVETRYAILLSAAITGSLIALYANNRFAMLIGGLCTAAIAFAVFAQVSIQSLDLENIRLGWAWIPIFGGLISLLASPFRSDHATPDSPLKAPTVFEGQNQQTACSFLSAQIIAIIGILFLAFMVTVGASYCSYESFLEQECTIAAESHLWNGAAFKESFATGIEQNTMSISLILICGIALFATFAKRPLSVAITGCVPFAFAMIMGWLYSLSVVAPNSEENITSDGWVFLCCGPILLVFAAVLFKLGAIVSGKPH